jgi:hypothetical protein
MQEPPLFARFLPLEEPLGVLPLENVTGFFSLLSQWSKADTAPPASDTHPHWLARAADGGEGRHEG